MGILAPIDLLRNGYASSISYGNGFVNTKGVPFFDVVRLSDGGGRQNERPSTQRTLHADVRDNTEGVAPNAQPSASSIRSTAGNSQEKFSCGSL